MDKEFLGHNPRAKGVNILFSLNNKSSQLFFRGWGGKSCSFCFNYLKYFNIFYYHFLSFCSTLSLKKKFKLFTFSVSTVDIMNFSKFLQFLQNWSCPLYQKLCKGGNKKSLCIKNNTFSFVTDSSLLKASSVIQHEPTHSCTCSSYPVMPRYISIFSFSPLPAVHLTSLCAGFSL